MQVYNIEGNSIINYVEKTNAKLKIMSVPTKFLLEFPFDAKWNTEEVFGRMDPIATYQGTKRTMSLGFDLPAGSLKEAKKNLKGCSELIKMVYPVYNNQDILAKPPLTRIQFANLIKGDAGAEISSTPASAPAAEDNVSGWISGLSWKPNLEMGMFAANGELYPKVISLSFSFNVLHEKTPSQKSKGMFPFGG